MSTEVLAKQGTFKCNTVFDLKTVIEFKFKFKCFIDTQKKSLQTYES